MSPRLEETDENAPEEKPKVIKLMFQPFWKHQIPFDIRVITILGLFYIHILSYRGITLKIVYRFLSYEKMLSKLLE